MPKHTLYFSDKTLAKIAVDPAGVEGLSARVSRLCHIAVDVMDDSIPTLPKAEWLALMDLSNGIHMSLSDHTPRDMAESFHFSIMESGPECNEKWGMNCVALAKKYRALPLAAQLAVIEVCRRFWTRPEVNAKFDNYGDIMAAHGARFED